VLVNALSQKLQVLFGGIALNKNLSPDIGKPSWNFIIQCHKAPQILSAPQLD
jgi:hypothetical protein